MNDDKTTATLAPGSAGVVIGAHAPELFSTEQVDAFGALERAAAESVLMEFRGGDLHSVEFSVPGLAVRTFRRGFGTDKNALDETAAKRVDRLSPESLLAEVPREVLSFTQRLKRWIDNRSRARNDAFATGLARYLSRRALSAVIDRTLEVLDFERKALREIQVLERELAREFVQQHTSTLKPAVTVSELDDLGRRLFDAHLGAWPAPEALQETAKTNTLLRAALREQEAFIKKESDRIVPGGAVLRATLREQEAFIKRERNRITGADSVSQRAYLAASDEDRMALSDARGKSLTNMQLAPVHAFHWPAVLEAWKLERKPTTLARFPTALAIGAGSIGPFFGHTPGGEMKATGRVEHVIVSRRGAQLGLPLGARRELPAKPTSDAIFGAVAALTGNRVFRFFGSVLVAAHDDFSSGAASVEGGFYYRPGRFADLLGLSDRESVKALDGCLQTLMDVSITATMKAGRETVKFTAKSLVIDGRGTLEPMAKRGRGRPSNTAHLFRIQDDVIRILRDGGAWLPLSRDVLAPPEGVDQRVWDDAFKVYLTLGSLARNTPRRGNTWRNKVATVLEAANVTKRGARPFERLKKLDDLCGHLQRAGLLVFSIEGDRLEFDVPKLRPALDSVPRKAKTLKPLKADR